MNSRPSAGDQLSVVNDQRSTGALARIGDLKFQI
jgi:hypothetical protein